MNEVDGWMGMVWEVGWTDPEEFQAVVHLDIL